MPYIQQNVHMMLDDEAFRTIEHVDNSLYVQEAVRKVVAGMLEISSAYMYNDAISKAWDADYEEPSVSSIGDAAPTIAFALLD